MRTSSIRLRANARLAILYEDYLEICDGNMLAAMLLSVLVYWTDIKIAKKEESRWVWKTHEDFQEDLMFDKPGMRAPHRTTISHALDVLRAKDFIQWRKNPKRALDRTRQYLVNLEEVQVAIDRLPPIVSRKTDIPMLENRHSTEQATEANSSSDTNVGKPTYDECRETDNALSEKQHCNVEKPTSNTNDYDTEITVPEITEDDRSLSSESDAPAENVSSFEEWKKKTDPQLPVIDTAYHIATGDYEKGDDEPTKPRMPAVKPPEQTPAASVSLSLAIAPNGGQDDTGSRQAIRDPGLPTLTPAASSGMSRTGNPPASPEARQAGLKIVHKAVTQEKLSMKEDAPVIRPPTAAQILKQQERRRDEILAIYAAELGRKPSRSKENLAGALLCAQDEVSDEDIRTTIKAILKDPFLKKNMSMAFVYKKLDALAGAPQKNGKAPPAPDAYGNDYSINALLVRQQKAM